MSTPENEQPNTPKIIRPQDIEAAEALVQKDRLLISDPLTRHVLKNNGKMPDGIVVEDLGHFLADRRAELEKNPPYLSGGKRNIGDVPPDSRGDDPDIWRKGTDK